MFFCISDNTAVTSKNKDNLILLTTSTDVIQPSSTQSTSSQSVASLGRKSLILNSQVPSSASESSLGRDSSTYSTPVLGFIPMASSRSAVDASSLFVENSYFIQDENNPKSRPISGSSNNVDYSTYSTYPTLSSNSVKDVSSQLVECSYSIQDEENPKIEISCNNEGLPFKHAVY